MLPAFSAALAHSPFPTRTILVARLLRIPYARGRKVFSNGLKLFDLLLMVVSFVVSTLPLFHRVGRFGLAEFFEMRVKLGNLILFVSFLVIWHILFSVFGLYASKRLSSRWEEIWDIAAATTLGTLHDRGLWRWPSGSGW